MALALWHNPEQSPDELAKKFLNEAKGINNTTLALEGARQILMEIWSEDAELTALLREYVWNGSN